MSPINTMPDSDSQEVHYLDNHPFDEIQLGDEAILERTLVQEDIVAFAAVTGDTNPAHVDPNYARDSAFHGVVGHGMWTASLISALLGTRYPGPGTIYLEQQMQFMKPVRIGDHLTVRVRVLEKNAENHHVRLNTEVTNQKGVIVLRGEARVLAPDKKIRYQVNGQTQIMAFDADARLRALLARCKDLSPVRCAVVHPCDQESLSGALRAADAGLIIPVLIGPRAKIQAAAQGLSVDLEARHIECIDVEHSHAAAERAAQMAASREVCMLMKGSLHTDELMRAILRMPTLHTGRRMSHVFHFDIPMYDKPLLITDAALNIQPTLMDKADIVQNAIDFAHVLGVDNPKVAILSAVETVTPTIPSTLDAAALCKMADRRQITGGELDGPLAFDNAISPHAVAVKHIISSVAGQADILLVPDLEAGNMLAKQLEYLAGASASGLVLGARVPVILTSRSDGSRERLASTALGCLLAAAKLPFASRD